MRRAQQPAPLQTVLRMRSKKAPRMPVPYSVDLGWRVIWLHLSHQLRVPDISQTLCVSKQTVRRYIIRAFESTDDIEPTP